MREHKSRWSHSWSLLLYGYVHCTTYPGFSTTLTNCVFQGRKQILSNSSRQTLSKTKKRKRNVWLHLLNYEHYFASKFNLVQTVHQKVWRKKSQNRNPTGPHSNPKVFKNVLISFDLDLITYQELHQSSNGLTVEINLRLLDIWLWKSKSFFDNFWRTMISRDFPSNLSMT